MPRQTQRERDAASRLVKLEDVERQVESGSLEIRSMTDAERARWARPASAAPTRRPKRTPPREVLRGAAQDALRGAPRRAPRRTP